MFSSDYQLPTMPDGQPLSETKCAICLAEFAGRDVRPVIVATQCNHIFDLECVSVWISNGNRQCSICRDVSLPLVRLDGAQWPESSKYCENKFSQLARTGDFNSLVSLFGSKENGDCTGWLEFFFALRFSPPNMLVRAGSYSAALEQACLKGNVACLRFLIESQYRCFINDYPMLHLAVQIGRPKIVAFLIDMSADVNHQWHGLTPLHLAACFNRLKCARLLLLADADVDLKNSDGERPVDVARNMGFEKIRKVLNIITFYDRFSKDS